MKSFKRVLFIDRQLMIIPRSHTLIYEHSSILQTWMHLQKPNLYLPVPGLPKFMEKPSLSYTIEFKKSIQLLKSGEDLAPDQAIGLQARAAVKMDSRIEHLNGEERSYLEGAAAGLAVSLLRNQSQMDKLPLLARALTDEYFNVVEDAIKHVFLIGPASDLVLKPVRFFVLERGEQVAVIWPGQVGWCISTRSHSYRDRCVAAGRGEVGGWTRHLKRT